MGRVFLVGAGPGDPGLITVRGLDLVRAADAIFFDNLATPALLSHAKPGAETLYVGKKRAAHTYSQEQINDMLVERARAGKAVVRLKGGDPSIFGRGGEEAEALADAGVPFEIVPGVSSALGAAAYAGIPLTHRSKTSAVTFVTGHAAEAIDWAKMGLADTLVLFMGLTSFADIAHRLIAAGRPASTPAAAIRWATRPDQQTVIGTLANLADRIEATGLKPPALVIVGDVVSLHARINWFEHLPLFGQRIVVTRPQGQGADFAEKLRRLGAEPIELPVIEIRTPGEGYGALDEAIGRLETYDWLLFTSRNGVERFVERLDASARDWRSLRARVAAIGPATAEALQALHLKVDILPESYVAEGLLAALEPFDLEGKRILIPRALVARDLLPETLRARGAHVDVVPAYETVAPEDSAGEARALFAADPPDWIAFTSSSTVTNLAKMVGADALRGVRAASIGPVTSATLREHGIEPAAEAAEFTVDGLIAAIVEASPQ